MLPISTDGLYDAYERLKSRCLSSGASVLILAAPDCDSLCACQILTGLLKADDIGYVLKPVAGYRDLRAVNDDCLKDGQYRSILLINCGALPDLGGRLPDLHRRARVLVIDSHRPFHLANVENEQIALFDEIDGEPSAFPPNEPDLGVDELEKSDEEDAEEFVDDDTFSDEESDSEFPSLTRRKKRRRRENDTEEQRDRRRKRDVLKKYYNDEYYGPSSAMLVFSLARSLNRSRDHFLWMAIAGVTDQFMHERVDRTAYNRPVGDLIGEVQRQDDDEDAADERIVFDDQELRFVLLRHWSLYDSMNYSPYVASQLLLWRESGRNKLHDFVAKMGFPLRECKQWYSCMDIRIKRSLKDKVNEHAKDFGLDDVVFGSFVKNRRNASSLAAADVVHIVDAFLTGDEDWKNSFNRAYDSLGVTGRDDLLDGLRLAQTHQKLIVTTGGTMIANKQIKRSTKFRYGMLSDAGAARPFCHPLLLLRLALFLANAVRADTVRYMKKNPGRDGKDSRISDLPLVLCALNDREGVYLVVGVPAASSRRRSNFGTTFRLAYEHTHARVRYDSFDASVIEIQAADVHLFLDSLQAKF